MSKIKLPAFLEEMPSGPHKRDENFLEEKNNGK